MAKKKIFVSFDYDNDKCYKFLLNAWNANSDFEFDFNDHSTQEIQTYDISRVKAALTTKINQATYTIIIVGKEMNKLHKDRAQIGHINWQHFELNQSVVAFKKIIYVKLHITNNLPIDIPAINSRTVIGFTELGIMNALKSF